MPSAPSNHRPSDVETREHPQCRSRPALRTRHWRLLALTTVVALAAGPHGAANSTGALGRDHASARLFSAVPALVETTGTTPVDLRVGPHRFRIPRACFRRPPHPSGVDSGFYLRALLPGLEPITDANRHVFRLSPSTEEGRRVVGLLFEVMPDRHRDDARWRLGNNLRRRGASLDDFAPATDATHGLRSLRGPPIGDSGWFERNLYWGELPASESRFVGAACDAGWEDRPGHCHLWVDWRGRTLDVSHERRLLPRWREIAGAALALMDRLAVTGGAEDGGPVR